MRIDIDPDRCIGAGQCVMSAPGVFDQRVEDGTAFVTAVPGPGEEAAVRDAAFICPSGAITVDE